jgi:hypothetical protein
MEKIREGPFPQPEFASNNTKAGRIAPAGPRRNAPDPLTSGAC